MVRILGNSPERVPLKDLGDVIYYKQVKEYTDAEYEASKDLKREVQRGKLIIVERSAIPRGSLEGSIGSKPADSPVTSQEGLISKADLKAMLSELMPNMGQKQAGSESIRDVVPLIADMIRQEMGKIGEAKSGGDKGSNRQAEVFQDLQFVPSVSTVGMAASIQADEKESSADGANDALAMLRKMNNK